MDEGWHVHGLAAIASPALLVWPDRVRENVAHMVDLCGTAQRLRPHVKTHKMDAVVRLQISAGITKFKASTISELEMCLHAGTEDVLLAYPLVGPGPDRLLRVAEAYPEAKLSFLADDPATLSAISQGCLKSGVQLGVFVDFDCGMGRTGTTSAEEAGQIAKLARSSPGLNFAGIHTYDGHIRETDPMARRAAWSEAMKSLDKTLGLLEARGHLIPSIVAGGSPTFGYHASLPDRECSPGTTLFWDHGYGSAYPDLPFQQAAAVLTRVISKPGASRLCLDLGHKAIASELPLERRIHLIGLNRPRFLAHSEEHLVLESDDASRFKVGSPILGIPVHICPTVALYREAALVREHTLTGEKWEVTARNRILTF